MTDHVSSTKRSEIMAAVKSQDTGPELALRRLLHRLGYRYRLHGESLPGKPDLVFPSKQKVLFVHGCFWHRHERCRYSTTPKSRISFWTEKFERNMERDRSNIRDLKVLGWRSLVVWQCQLKVPERAIKRVVRFLEKE